MANCKECKEKRMEVNTPENVPYIVHEGDIARMERIVKRLWIAVIVLAVLVAAVVGIGAYERLQYDYSGEEFIIDAEQDGEGVNIVGGGNVDYGAESTDS